ncbi:hypothetical protein VULLAG_LOCUS15873 [Vulpes lagopus]
MAAWHATEKRRGERPSSSISWHRCLRGSSESLDPPKISDTRSCRWTVICFLPNVDSKVDSAVCICHVVMMPFEGLGHVQK